MLVPPWFELFHVGLLININYSFLIGLLSVSSSIQNTFYFHHESP